MIDTQSDLVHARQMIEMFSKVWPAMPQRVINTHEDAVKWSTDFHQPFARDKNP